MPLRGHMGAVLLGSCGAGSPAECLLGVHAFPPFVSKSPAPAGSGPGAAMEVQPGRGAQTAPEKGGGTGGCPHLLLRVHVSALQVLNLSSPGEFSDGGKKLCPNNRVKRMIFSGMAIMTDFKHFN